MADRGCQALEILTEKELLLLCRAAFIFNPAML